MEFKKFNNIIGWIIFGIALTVYGMTVEPTASFWDCGEYIAVSYKLEVPHPPGAPFFLLMGRIFSMFAPSEDQVAIFVNFLSVISAAFTIQFLFWSLTMIGRKIMKVKLNEETPYQRNLLLASAFVGALSCTFVDSFWFSAVEAEVYAFSAFFTSFLFWAALKWEYIEDTAASYRWLLLISLMVGLSIGVHLLNLLTLPALALIIYFNKYKNTTRWGIFYAIAIGLAVVIFILYGIITGLPSIAEDIEIFFVNSLGLPFGSGIIFLGLLIVGGLVYAIVRTYRQEKVVLNLAFTALAFILIGYAAYSMVPIRSSYDPPIDENDPESIMSFVSYLKREQYGSRPLLYGRYFTAEQVDRKKGAPIYKRGKDEYEITDHQIEPVYDSEHKTIFPRAWSQNSGLNHQQLYREKMGLSKGEKPTFIDNLEYMFEYQIGHMYMRYFLWNFAGRQSDFKDWGFLWPTDTMGDNPDILEKNMARNQYYMLPLLLGIIGLFFHSKRDPKSFGIVAVLFLMTGLGIVGYLNMPPVEPRERDYIFAGSYYAYTMWIGIGVMGIAQFLTRFLSPNSKTPIIAGAIGLIVPGIMAAEGWDDHDRSDRYFSEDAAKNYLSACEENAILFTGGDNDTFPLWYAQEVEGFRTDVRVIVLSYFNTEWYINQMTRQAYESEPLPISLTQENYRQGGPNDYLPYVNNPQIKGAIKLDKYIDLIRQNSSAIKVPRSGVDYNMVPSRKFALDVDTSAVKSMDIIPKDLQDHMVSKLNIKLQGQALYKKDLMILDIIANNNWERPIYFNNTSLNGTSLNVKNNVVNEGLVYRLLPIQKSGNKVNTEAMYDNLMNKFRYRELDNPSVYYNDDYRNFVINHRSSFHTLAQDLLREGKKEKAREVMQTYYEKMPDEGVLYNYVSARSVSTMFKVGMEEKAVEIAKTMGDRSDEMLSYMNENGLNFNDEQRKNLLILNTISRTLNNNGEQELANKYQQAFSNHYQRSGAQLR